ncbi:MAG: dynamin family protein [Thermodesulforhabdaceae bacterium]
MISDGLAFEKTRKLMELALEVKKLVMGEFPPEVKAIFDERGKKLPGENPDILERLKDLESYCGGEKKPLVAMAGQIKSGKTTLMNALFFRDEVLPTSVSPETARLTIIKWGNKRKAEVEFYSPEEWEQIVEKSRSRTEDSKWAQEMVNFAEHALGSEIHSVLGTTREVEWDEIEDFVSSRGKYSYVVKQATLYLEHDILRSLDIVDTPGLDDPIEARSNTTRELLKRAVAILYCTAPSIRFMDSKDINYLAEFVEKASHSSVVTAVTQLDRLRPDERTRLKEMLRKASSRVLEASKNFGYGDSLSKEMARIFDPNRIIEVSAALYLVGMRVKNGRLIREKDKSIIERAKANKWGDDPEEWIKQSGIDLLESKLDELIVKNMSEIITFVALNFLKTTFKNLHKEAQDHIAEIDEELDNARKGLEVLEKELNEKRDYLRKMELEGREFRVSIKEELLKHKLKLEKRATLNCGKINVRSEDISSEEAMKRRFSFEIRDRISNSLEKAKKSVQEGFNKLREDLNEVVLDHFIKKSESTETTVKLRESIVSSIERTINYFMEKEVAKFNVKLNIDTGFLGWRRWFDKDELVQNVYVEVNEVLSQQAGSVKQILIDKITKSLDGLENAIMGTFREEIEERLRRLNNEITLVEKRKEEGKKEIDDIIDKKEKMRKSLESLKEEISRRLSRLGEIENIIKN